MDVYEHGIINPFSDKKFNNIKELLIMDYKNKYNEALERARELSKTITGANYEYIFPELKEDEDELIWLKNYISEEAYYLSIDIRDDEDRIKLQKLQKSLAWLEKQGEQKPTDKIETKFKVGDWIISHYNHVAYIKSIDEKNYSLSCNDGNSERLSIDYVNRNWRLWTIQDAKDGDVLYAKGTKDSYFRDYIFNFSSFTEDNVISTNFGYDVFHGAFDTELSRFGREEDFVSITPASKEQRDLLFTKMKEAGYEWANKPKELK